MGLRNIHVAGADSTYSNSDTTNWLQSGQVTTARTKIYSISINVPSGVGADRYVYLWDSATTPTLADPDLWLRAYNGVTTIVDLGGKLFNNGLYLYISDTEAASPATDITGTDEDDKALVHVDYRVL
jgi:hypothetical protein